MKRKYISFYLISLFLVLAGAATLGIMVLLKEGGGINEACYGFYMYPDIYHAFRLFRLHGTD